MESKVINKRKVIYEVGQSFKYAPEQQLTTSLHCHSEYEVVYVVDGHGKEFIGDSVRAYQEGDLVLIGPYLPHLYLSDSPASENNNCRILLLPAQMENIQEYANIYAVLKNSSRGVCFHSRATKNEVLQMMDALEELNGINRLLMLFRLLDRLGRTNSITLISTLKYNNPLKEYHAEDPVSQIFSYLINYHRQEISLENIAASVHMNPTSLCRYFKQRTGKTLFQCLTEIRVEYACKLLGNSNLTVSQIAWQSGFRNQAHFNKQFRIITGQTPTEYKFHLNDI